MSVLKTIAHIQNSFTAKFGIPRQSGLIEELESVIVFEPAYNHPDALRGLENFTHIWLLWQFSESTQNNNNNNNNNWSATVRPPKLGGNTRLGVFATRSPFRPNPIGLSCVKINKIELDSPKGPLIYVSGADLMNGTPIYDIKPYLPFTDSRPEAAPGFIPQPEDIGLKVNIDAKWRACLTDSQYIIIHKILEQDPRPSYHSDPSRTYGFEYDGLEIKFNVQGDALTVIKIERIINKT